MTNYGFLIWAIPLLIILSTVALLVATKKHWLWLPLPFLTLLLVWAATGSEVVAYTSGIFGAGAMLSMVVVSLSCLLLVMFVIIGAWLLICRRDIVGHPDWHSVYYGSVALLIVGLSVHPIKGSRRIHNQCDQQNRTLSAPVVMALKTYVQAKGQYPETLDVLLPDYLPTIPTLQCFETYEKYDPGHYVSPIEIVTCSDEVTVLVVPDLSNSFPQRYNLATGEWSQFSFLDGACSYVD